MNEVCSSDVSARGAHVSHNQVHQQQPLQRTEFDPSGRRTHDQYADSMEIESPVSQSEQAPSQWHRDEHARFMQALEAYGGGKSGDEWHKIAAFVQTRSIEDVRLHGRTYLQQLMQLQQPSSRTNSSSKSFMVNPLQYPLTASRELQALGANQNDPNGPNYAANQSYSSQSDTKVMGGKTKNKASTKATSRSYLTAASLSASNTVNDSGMQSNTGMIDMSQSSHPTTHKKGPCTNARPSKVWSFQDDKIFETSLATWTSGKPYSWPKIAAVIPGKTAKDVRARYERLVEDVTNIDNDSIPKPMADVSSIQSAKGHSARPPPHSSSGLSSRIAPPPPIEVSPTSKGKNGSNKVSTMGFSTTGMLSPTFLDFLTGEEKPHTGGNSHTNTSLIASNFLSSPLHLDMGVTPQHRRQSTPKDVSTPRIWHDFLAEDFKMDHKSVHSNSNDRVEVSPRLHNKRVHELDTRQPTTSRPSSHCT